jgi:hypothetical protein
MYTFRIQCSGTRLHCRPQVWHANFIPLCIPEPVQHWTKYPRFVLIFVALSTALFFFHFAIDSLLTYSRTTNDPTRISLCSPTRHVSRVSLEATKAEARLKGCRELHKQRDTADAHEAERARRVCEGQAVAQWRAKWQPRHK